MRLWLLVLASRLHGLLRRGRLDDDFESELASHVDLLSEEYLRRGLSAAEARRAAVVRLGGLAKLREQRRDERSLPWVETALQDIRYGLRGLRRHPAFSLVAIATLAVGIGAGTTIFTFVRAVLLRPLPYSNPHELVRIYETNPLRGWTKNIVAPANWADWRLRNSAFTDIAAFEQFTFVGSGATEVFLTGFGEAQSLKSLGVTGNLFSVLGAQPFLGRRLTDDETYDGKNRVAVLSYGLWRSAFGGDPGIVGRTITLSGLGYEVVGVMPRSFFFPGRDVQLWIPVGYTRELIAQSRRPHWLGVVARRRPGITLEQARQDLTAIARQLEHEYPATNTQMGVRVEDLHDTFASEPRAALLMLSAAVGVLFVIVCANIANLQLGRAISRSRELAIRRALGAGKRRLLGQFCAESITLSVIGGLLGLGLTLATRSALTQYAGTSVFLFSDVRIDRSVLLVALALSLMAPVVFGILPAFIASRQAQLTSRVDASSRQTRRLRNVLVAGEVALSTVLLVGAVLLVRSLSHLQNVDPGFNPERAIAFTISLPTARYTDQASRFATFSEIERRIRQQPGVQVVGASSTLALRGYTWSGDATIEGRAAGEIERDLRHMSTTRDYFKAMGVPLSAGRFFEDSDVRGQPALTIVNTALARKYYPGQPLEQVVGKRLMFGRPQDNAPWNTIVGVVADEKQDGLDKPAEPTAYSSIAQRQQNPMTFVIRSPHAAEAMVATARRTVADIDNGLALTEVTTLEGVVDSAMAGYRFRTMLLSVFAGVALLLAALGIYGVLAYFVSQRARELGIRLALGAKPSEVFRLVIRQGLRPVAAGAAAGVAGALALTRLMQSLLFGVEAIDPTTYVAALVVLGTSAVAACALPALRATRVDPLIALRDE